MLKFLIQLNNGIEPLRALSIYTAAPLFDLAIRLYIAWFFFSSGLIKAGGILGGNFAGVVEQFEFFYPVSLFGYAMDPAVAAVAATLGEIILPILLAIGLFGRFAAFGLMIISAVITFGTDNAVFFESVVLFVITGSLAFKGIGFISLDHLLVSFLRGRHAAAFDFRERIGLDEIKSDIPGHEPAGRFIRTMATGFWYTIFGIGVLHFLAAIVTLIPGVDLSGAMIVNMFSKTTPDGALAGYLNAIIYAYILGLGYAVTSLKFDVVYSFRKSLVWVVASGLIFMVLYSFV